MTESQSPDLLILPALAAPERSLLLPLVPWVAHVLEALEIVLTVAIGHAGGEGRDVPQTAVAL